MSLLIKMPAMIACKAAAARAAIHQVMLEYWLVRPMMPAMKLSHAVDAMIAKVIVKLVRFFATLAAS